MESKDIFLFSFIVFCIPCVAQSIFRKRDIVNFLSRPSYFNYEQLTRDLEKVSSENENLVKLHSIGKSVQNRSIWAVEITENVSERRLLKPMVKYVANMHGDETVGRQMLIYLLHYLLENYEKNSTISKLINETDIFLVPSMNPDGFESSQVSNAFHLYIVSVRYCLHNSYTQDEMY